MVEVDPDTEVRLLRGNCLRLVSEEAGLVKIYHSVENTREYREVEEQFLEVEPEMAPLVEALVQAYPRFSRVEELPGGGGLDDKMRVAASLWERGLLLTRLDRGICAFFPGFPMKGKNPEKYNANVLLTLLSNILMSSSVLNRAQAVPISTYFTGFLAAFLCFIFQGTAPGSLRRLIVQRSKAKTGLPLSCCNTLNVICL